eukprot:gene12824-7175_t
MDRSPKKLQLDPYFLCYSSYFMYKNSEEITPVDMKCDFCKKETTLDQVTFIDVCSHIICEICLQNLEKEIVEKKLTFQEIKCPVLNCEQVLTDNFIKINFSKENYESILNFELEKILNNDKFVKCPKCFFCIEMVKKSSKDIEKELEELKKPLTKENLHKEIYRFRCRECETDFCSDCLSEPYHENFTCETFKKFKESKKCRFCFEVIPEENDFCENEECIKKQEFICTKTLSCGHACCGLKDEENCLNCLVCDSKQSAEDLCNVCYVEELSQSPCIKLHDCGHIFHFECIKKKIQNKWSGSRITFNFLNCPLCKIEMNHISLESFMKDFKNLKSSVEEMSLARLKFEKLENTEEISGEKGRFYKNPTGYAMFNFAYYQCFECSKPYFGGMKRCEQIVDENFDPKDLVCGSCVSKKMKNMKECPKHKTEFIDFKCKFCCNIATFFCWGKTHFCDDCHKIHYKVTKLKREELPKCIKKTCPSGGDHPENGEEYSLGCGICKTQIGDEENF